MEDIKVYKKLYLLVNNSFGLDDSEDKLVFNFTTEVIGYINENNKIFEHLLKKINYEFKEDLLRKALQKDENIKIFNKKMNEKKPTSILLTFDSVKETGKRKYFGEIQDQGKILTPKYILDNLPNYLIVEIVEIDGVEKIILI